MIITKKFNNPVCYIHIPKTGGTSIGSALKYNRNIHGGRHVPLSEHDISDNMFVFTFVRDPFERFIAFFFKRMCLRHHKKYKNIGFKLSNSKQLNKSDNKMLAGLFNDWVKNWYFDYSLNYEDKKYDNIVCKWSIMPNSMTKMIQPLERVDFIGKFENIEEDWGKLLMNLGKSGVIGDVKRINNISHENKIGEGISYRRIIQHIDKKVLLCVLNAFEEDFYNFGYDIKKYKKLL
jgi:hypothetical protein